MKKIFYLTLILTVFSCGSSSKKDKKSKYVWNYFLEHNEMDEESILSARVYSKSNYGWDWPYNNPGYFLEIKVIIPDYIKSYEDFEYYVVSHKSYLINIKCESCPIYDYGKKTLKSKFDNNTAFEFQGYSAKRDNDGLDKYNIDDAFYSLDNIKNHNLLKIEIPTIKFGRIKLNFDVSDFKYLDVIRRNKFPQSLAPSNKKEYKSSTNLETIEDDEIIPITRQEVKPPPPPPPPPPPEMIEIEDEVKPITSKKLNKIQKYATINVDNLNFRNTAEISNNIIGKLKLNQEVFVFDTVSINFKHAENGMLNKNITVEHDELVYSFNKNKAIKIISQNGDNELIVMISIGNEKSIELSLPTSAITLKTNEVWAKIEAEIENKSSLEHGALTGYVYYKFLNIK